MIICTLKELMKMFGVNQTKLSEETGITRPTLLSLIRNENQNIKYDTINSLCNYFGIGLSDLLLYSPINIEFKEVTYKEEIETINTEGQKSLNIPFEYIFIRYFIDDKEYIFQADLDSLVVDVYRKDFNTNEELYVLPINEIDREEYETLLQKGFKQDFFNYYNDSIRIKEKIANSLPLGGDTDLINLDISFAVGNSPLFDDIKEEIKNLPTDKLQELKIEINKLLD